MFDRIYSTLFKVYEKHDLSSWEREPGCVMNIYGVYHVLCERGWETLVREQVAALKESGLYAVTKRIYVSCIALGADDADKLVRIIGEEKAVVIFKSHDPLRFEYAALDFVRTKSLEEDCLIYYFHTKGITYYNGNVADRHFLAFRRNVEAWRKMMEYFVFTKWHAAVNVLLGGYDTYGCFRMPPPPHPFRMYAGNFWWARSSYLHRLPAFPEGVVITNRYLAEEWIYKGAPHDFSAFDCTADLYYVYMDKAVYADSKVPLFKWLKLVISHNWVKTRKHLFKYDYKAKRMDRYQITYKGG